MTTVLQIRDFFGSKFRCLALTGMADEAVAETLTRLITPVGEVRADRDKWMPRGPRKPVEAKLRDEENDFLDADQRKALTEWWLSIPRGANEPNWDIVSTCHIGNKRGLLIGEAKAHAGELEDCGKAAGNTDNHDQIGMAIEQTNIGLATASGLDGWNLSRDRCYQLSNRFAWAWKIASLGTPVALVYLGFLNAVDMGESIFRSHDEWKARVLEHSRGLVPEGAWENSIDVNGTPLYATIRSLELTFRSR